MGSETPPWPPWQMPAERGASLLLPAAARRGCHARRPASAAGAPPHPAAKAPAEVCELRFTAATGQDACKHAHLQQRRLLDEAGHHRAAVSGRDGLRSLQALAEEVGARLSKKAGGAGRRRQGRRRQGRWRRGSCRQRRAGMRILLRHCPGIPAATQARGRIPQRTGSFPTVADRSPSSAWRTWRELRGHENAVARPGPPPDACSGAAAHAASAGGPRLATLPPPLPLACGLPVRVPSSSLCSCWSTVSLLVHDGWNARLRSLCCRRGRHAAPAHADQAAASQQSTIGLLHAPLYIASTPPACASGPSDGAAWRELQRAAGGG